jgi:hypothetical protein
MIARHRSYPAPEETFSLRNKSSYIIENLVCGNYISNMAALSARNDMANNALIVRAADPRTGDSSHESTRECDSEQFLERFRSKSSHQAGCRIDVTFYCCEACTLGTLNRDIDFSATELSEVMFVRIPWHAHSA